MQIASHGARATARDVSAFAHAVPRLRGAARSIHIPAFNPPTSSGAARRILTSARSFLSRAIVHLTAPGIGAHHVASMSRSIHGGLPGRMPTIQQRMTGPMRYTLSRPAHMPYFPRAPTVPRTMTQVGLGTARNFSSGRILFQNVVQNVPVAGRAFCEIDWDLHLQQEREKMKKTIVRDNNKKAKKIALKEKENMMKSSVRQEKTVESADIEQYFVAPVTKAVTTALLIPLAPTPTSRMPLPADTLPHESLLPLPALASMHNAHELHALRVSALFSRLDAANVWDRGVECSAYGSRAGAEGVCTILKVEFVGWTKAEVRSVIGESGTGWCDLEEISTIPEEEEADFSDTSSVLSSPASEQHVTFSEPAQSLVLPTLDFSASLSQRTFSRAPSDDDLFSDIHSDFEIESVSDSSHNSASSNGWLLFSSDFAQRAGHNDTPEPAELYF